MLVLKGSLKVSFLEKFIKIMGVIGRYKVGVVLNWVFLAVSVVSPLMALPFLSRVFGQESFGQYLLIISLSSFAVLVCDFGFNVSSAKRMALANEDATLRSEIIWITTVIKLILVAIVIIGYLILVHSVSNYAYLRQSLLPVVCYLAFLSMQPVWYFIGIQKVALNSALVSLGRIGPLIFLVLYIDGPEDLNLAIKIQAAGVILCCALSYAYIASREYIGLRMPSVGQLIGCVRDDYLLFLSNIVIGTYASLNSILLGANSNFNEVATYAGIEKIFKTLESFISSTGTIFFASIARKIKNKPSAGSEDINQIVWFYCFLGIVILVISALFGSDLLRILYGSEFNYDSPSIWLLMFLPLFGSLATAWGNLGLLNFGHNAQFFRIILFGSIVNIIIISLTSSKYGAIGAAASVFTATVIIAFLMRYYFKKHLIAISK